MCAEPMVEGTVSGAQRDRHARQPGELWTHLEQAGCTGQILGLQVGNRVRTRDEGHAAAFHRYIDQRDPGRERMPRVAVRPVGKILMKLGWRIVVRLLDQDMVMPEA